MKASGFALLLAALLVSTTALGDIRAFSTGPAIEDYGPAALVSGAMPIPTGTTFKIAFDVRVAGEGDKPNRTLEAAARFFNMHARAGVPVQNIELAVVVHGPAHRDLLKVSARSEPNPSAALIEQLIAHGVKIHLCGQTAAFYDVKVQDLLPGVEMSLSAMTSHALLQQQGYTLNPF
ncbi:MAG: DsrE family protein [Halieaceae bacterium]|nr:DsrE family protein [Halieaceae bacterium]